MKQVTNQEFEELLKGEKTVFADFWATWCAPCRMLAPIFEGLAEKNVDEQTETAIKYGVSSIPNVIAFRGGKAVANSLGYVPENELEDFIIENM